MGIENHMPQRIVRFDQETWDELGRVVGNRNRSKIIRDLVSWYLREPGAKLPKRPGDKGFEDAYDPYPATPDPQSHALYRFFDGQNNLLYVGITMDLPSRMQDHRRQKPWWTDVAWIKVDHYDNRSDVFEAERVAIKSERPLYNIIHNEQLEPGAAAGAIG